MAVSDDKDDAESQNCRMDQLMMRPAAIPPRTEPMGDMSRIKRTILELKKYETDPQAKRKDEASLRCANVRRYPTGAKRQTWCKYWKYALLLAA